MAKTPTTKPSPNNPEADTHAERVERELAEQESLLAQVREDSERHDRAAAELSLTEVAEETEGSTDLSESKGE